MSRTRKTDYAASGYKHREHRSKKGRRTKHKKKRIWEVKRLLEGREREKKDNKYN